MQWKITALGGWCNIRSVSSVHSRVFRFFTVNLKNSKIFLNLKFKNKKIKKALNHCSVTVQQSTITKLALANVMGFTYIKINTHTASDLWIIHPYLGLRRTRV